MKTYTLKLKTTSTTNYNLYDGTTLVSDSDLATLFATAGSAYFVFDFNSLTPTNTTSLTILDSQDTTVITNTGLSGIAEDKNFKGTWGASATAFASFELLKGITMDEAQLGKLVELAKSGGGGIGQLSGNINVWEQEPGAYLVAPGSTLTLGEARYRYNNQWVTENAYITVGTVDSQWSNGNGIGGLLLLDGGNGDSTGYYSSQGRAYFYRRSSGLLLSSTWGAQYVTSAEGGTPAPGGESYNIKGGQAAKFLFENTANAAMSQADYDNKNFPAEWDSLTPQYYADSEVEALNIASELGWSHAGLQLLNMNDAVKTFATKDVFTAPTAVDGKAGLVPAPTASDALKFLNASTGWTAFPQANWNQNSSVQNDYIQNKPFYTDTQESVTNLGQFFWAGTSPMMWDTPAIESWITSTLGTTSGDPIIAPYVDPNYSAPGYQLPSAVASAIQSGDSITFEFPIRQGDMMMGEMTTYQFKVSNVVYSYYSDPDSGLDYYRASGTAQWSTDNWATSHTVNMASVYYSSGTNWTFLIALALDPYQQWMVGGNPGDECVAKEIVSTEVVHQMDSKYIKLDPTYFEIDSQGRITLKQGN